MSIQASLYYEAVNRIEQWVQRIEAVGYGVVEAIEKVQPCQKTNVNAGTGETSTSPSSTAKGDDGNGAKLAEHSSSDPVRPSAPPSEPQAVEAISESVHRCRMIVERGRSEAWGTFRPHLENLLAHIDTLSARLKRAEELLRDVNVFRARLVLDGIGIDVADNIHEFLDGKEST